MKNTKFLRILLIALSALMALSLISCSEDAPEVNGTQEESCDTEFAGSDSKEPSTDKETESGSAPVESEGVTSDGETEKPTESESDTDTDVEEIDNLSAISPEVGATVVLANDTIYKWYKSFNGTSSTVPAAMKEDLYFPVPVTLEWACEDAVYYLVYLSTSEDMSGALSFVANKKSVTVENLFVGTDYYWQVDAIFADKTLRSEVFSFTTALSPRTVTIEGVSNTRDIGGLPTADGNMIKQGMIYRGGKLNDITEKGKQQFLYVLGIKTDYDLRTIGEGGAGVKSPVSDSLKYFNFDGRYYVGPYGKGFDTEEGKAIMADEVRVFADPSNYPVYIHCSLGRDRTGTIVFIIQALCGVERTDLLMDYEMSMFSVSGTLDGANPFEAIKATYTYINDNYEGDSFAEKTENYLLSIGITAEEIATIRSIMIEEVK